MSIHRFKAFPIATAGQRLIQAVANPDDIILVNDKQLQLAVLFYGTAIFSDLRFGMHSHISLRLTEGVQRHFNDVHSLTTSMYAFALGSSSAAVITMSGSML